MIQSSWIPLEEVIARRTGSVDPSKFPDEVFELLSIPAFDAGRPEVVRGRDIGSSKQVVQLGDVLLSKIVPHIRRAWVVSPTTSHRLIASGEWIVFRDERFLPGYLKHLLTADGFHRQFMQTVSGVGGSLLRARPSEVAKIRVPVPSKVEQQRVATILDTAESLSRKRQEAIQLADEFLKAVFYEKFGDPVTNSKGLPTSRIEQLCDVATGSTPARNRADYYDGPHPWIKTGEVDTPLITSAEEHISDAAIAETNCKLFPIGTLLVAMYGQGKTRGKVGMLGIPAATNQACAAILPSQKINRHFLYSQLSLMYEHLRAMGRGGNQENLNLGMIKSLEVLVPPDQLVNEFLTVRQKVFEMTSKALRAQSDSEAMVQSLAAKFFA
jgi:type I restriction enzyme S subunit